MVAPQHDPEEHDEDADQRDGVSPTPGPGRKLPPSVVGAGHHPQRPEHRHFELRSANARDQFARHPEFDGDVRGTFRTSQEISHRGRSSEKRIEAKSAANEFAVFDYTMPAGRRRADRAIS